jgi:ABC-type multidrug transport system ATPase subunit
MLQIEGAWLHVGEGKSQHAILQDVSVHFPRPHFGAVIGPSGCGKSTLLKLITGLAPSTEGTVRWDGRDLELEEDIAPSQLGYVPQFSIFHESLTVAESLHYALKLRVDGLSGAQRERRVNHVLERTGLGKIADRRGWQLSGGQRRRLGLALELLSRPTLLLCDEVTSGLDPASEEEIVVLLRELSRRDDEDERPLVLSVTHSVAHLSMYDSVTVLFAGVLAYSGPPHLLLPYFKVASAEDIYGQLGRRTPEEWAARWKINLDVFGLPALPPPEQLKIMAAAAVHPPPIAKPVPSESQSGDGTTLEIKSAGREAAASGSEELPSAASQFFTLLGRRWRIFFREKNQVWLHLTLLFLFPALVVPFAIEGLPQVRNLSLGLDVNPLLQAQEGIEFIKQTSRVGGLVSGLIMFQVILMTLTGANNGAREIVAERRLFEKEKLAGLSAGAYLASKACFLFVLVAMQAAWMMFFVKFITEFPGAFLPQFVMLLLANGALTFVTLGVSSWSRSTEQASLISIYFVGFQLPLSGAFLAMPDSLGMVTRPFIAAYWSWSGFLQTLVHTRYYDLAEATTPTPLSPLDVCGGVLAWHIVAGLLIAYFGLRNSRWE